MALNRVLSSLKPHPPNFACSSRVSGLLAQSRGMSFTLPACYFSVTAALLRSRRVRRRGCAPRQMLSAGQPLVSCSVSPTKEKSLSDLRRRCDIPTSPHRRRANKLDDDGQVDCAACADKCVARCERVQLHGCASIFKTAQDEPFGLCGFRQLDQFIGEV